LLPGRGKVGILQTVQQTSASSMGRELNERLGKGQRDRGATRLMPVRGFMEGKEAADLFRDHLGDPEAADAIAREMAKLSEEEH
jgi:hypothetical protein